MFDKLKKIYEEEYLPLEKKNQEYIENNKKLISRLFQNKYVIIKKFKDLNKIYESFNTKNIFNIKNELELNRNNLETILKINKVVSIATPIISACAGTTVGLGTAAGLWAITSTFGVASTGMPIIFLSGIASTNAILAAIGGGSLAVGGLGIVGGLSALGGVVATPILVVTIYHTNKRVKKNIEEYKHQLKLIDENIPKLLEINANYRELNFQLEKMILELEENLSIFLYQYKNLNKRLYPIPFFSKFFFRNFANKDKYYKKYSKEINEILDTSKLLIENFF